MGYVRFAVRWKDKDSGRGQGLFQAAWVSRDAGLMSAHQEEQHDALRDWFSKNLEAPDRFDKNKNHHRPGLGLSWFKDDAQEHIDKMREFAELLRTLDVVVDEVYSDRPGKVLYEDKFQVLAKPYQDSGL